LGDSVLPNYLPVHWRTEESLMIGSSSLVGRIVVFPTQPPPLTTLFIRPVL
jgi:hypothetical protein